MKTADEWVESHGTSFYWAEENGDRVKQVRIIREIQADALRHAAGLAELWFRDGLTVADKLKEDADKLSPP